MEKKNPFYEKKIATNNPLDLFSTSKEVNLAKKPEIIKISSKIDDSVFLNVLIKDKGKKDISKKEEKKVYEEKHIYKSMRIISKSKLQINKLKYYKFPFDSNTINDNSSWYNLLYREWKKGLKSVYKRFKYNSSKFIVSFNGHIMLFQDSVARVSLGMREKLLKEEIYFVRISDHLLIEGIDVALLFDFLLNFEYIQIPLPFILSHKEFENSIIYHTEINRKITVQIQGEMFYHYEVYGYFFGEDYKEYFDANITFNID